MAPCLHKACAQEELLLFSKENWHELNWCTLKIAKINAVLVENEGSLLLVFVYVESGTPIVHLCISVAFFPPQECVETFKPEQLHLCSHCFFKD